MQNLRNRLNCILNGRIGAVIFFVALFFIHTPYELTLMPVISTMVQFMPYVVLAFLLFCFVELQKSAGSFFKDELILFLFLGWLFLYLVFSAVSGSYWQEVFMDNILAPLNMILLISVYSKVNVRKLILYLFAYYLIINTLNNASAFFFHNRGMWQGSLETRRVHYVLIGHANNSSEVALPSMLAGIIFARQYDRSWTPVNIINIVFSLTTAFVINCDIHKYVYSIVFIALILCMIYDRLPKTGRIFRLFSAGKWLVFDLLVFDAVVILGKTTGWMEKLGMDPRVHGRRELWDLVIETIFDHPIIAQGYSSGYWPVINGSAKYMAHVHSIYLQIPVETGLIGLALLIAMFVICVRSIYRSKSGDIRFIFSVVFGGLLLLFTIEMSRRVLLFLMLAIFYYIPPLIAEKEPQWCETGFIRSFRKQAVNNGQVQQ